jgi:hypothetical protein
LDTKDNLFRFNQKMESVDVEKKAKNKGAKSGDALIVYGNELVVE